MSDDTGTSTVEMFDQPPATVLHGPLIWQTIIDLASGNRAVSLPILTEITGLTSDVVDEHVARMIEGGKLRCIADGMFEPVHDQAPDPGWKGRRMSMQKQKRDWFRILRDLMAAGVSMHQVARVCGRHPKAVLAWAEGGDPKDTDARMVLQLYARFCPSKYLEQEKQFRITVGEIPSEEPAAAGG